MANEKSSGGRSYPGLEYVNDCVALLQTLILEQSFHLGGIVDEIQDNAYTLDSWTRDVSRFWASGVMGWQRLALLPIQKAIARKGVLPTVVFLADKNAQTVGPQTLDVSGSPLDTELEATTLKEVGGTREISGTFLNLKKVGKDTFEVTLSRLPLAKKKAMQPGAPDTLDLPDVPFVAGHFSSVIYAAGGTRRTALAIVHAIIDGDDATPPPMSITRPPTSTSSAPPVAIPKSPRVPRETVAKHEKKVTKRGHKPKARAHGTESKPDKNG